MASSLRKFCDRFFDERDTLLLFRAQERRVIRINLPCKRIPFAIEADDHLLEVDRYRVVCRAEQVGRGYVLEGCVRHGPQPRTAGLHVSLVEAFSTEY